VTPEVRPDGSLRIARPKARARLLTCSFAVLLAVGGALDPNTNAFKVGLSAFFAIGGCLAAGALESVVFDFDASRRVFRWSRSSWYRRSGGEIPFDLVEDVSVRVRVYRSQHETSRWNQVELRARGERFELASFRARRELEAIELANRFRLLLGLATPVEHTVEDLVAQGDTVAAVKLAMQLRGLSLDAARQLVDELAVKPR
jgi:hypothetical protein